MMQEEINKCIKILKAGGLILYPTDTVWGIGCDATNEAAVEKIYQLKQRSDAKSLIVLIANDAMLNKSVKDVPELAWDLIDLSETPTTIVYENGRNLAKNVLATDGSIGIRMTKNDFCNRLIHRFNRPIVSTSANISGANSPSNFLDISEEVKTQVDHIVSTQFDQTKGQPSSIIKLAVDGKISILRK